MEGELLCWMDEKGEQIQKNKTHKNKTDKIKKNS